MFKVFSRVNAFYQGYAKLVCLALGVLAIELASPGNAYAATGGQLFHDYACDLQDLVLKQDFGAMMTAIAGLLALIMAAVGIFRGAWLLIFVSVGIYIYPGIVATFFPPC